MPTNRNSRAKDRAGGQIDFNPETYLKIVGVEVPA
jgi:hypothetical protein